MSLFTMRESIPGSAPWTAPASMLAMLDIGLGGGIVDSSSVAGVVPTAGIPSSPGGISG